MRTTLDLDDDLMKALLARHPGATKTRAVERAIEDHLRQGTTQALLALAGTMELEDMSRHRRNDRQGGALPPGTKGRRSQARG